MKTEHLETLKSFKKHLQETQHRHVGYIRGTKSRFGFLDTEEGQDIFIPPQEMDRVFVGDRVALLVKNLNGKEETHIEEILEHNFNRFVGVFTEDETGCYVKPEEQGINRKIRIPKSKCKNAKHNQYVKAEIIEYPHINKKPKARILSVIGDQNAPGIENDLIIAKYGILYKPSFNARRELIEFDHSKIEEAFNQSHRKDLTHLPFVTIDGESTMDIDDAIYAEKEDDQWKLFVAISDVSEIVTEESAIDRDALKKTSSIYFTGKMLPMLPPEIATDICSLRENEKKLALVAELSISNSGELIGYNFIEAIIESRAKMSYSEVEDFILNNSEEFNEKYGSLTEQVSNLYRLHQILNQNRKINYIIPEFKTDYRLLLDQDKKIKDVLPLNYKISNKIVEECMIIANIAAAQFLRENYDMAIYKTHEGIDIEKFSKLKILLKRYFPTFEEDDLQDIDKFKEVLQQAKKADATGRIKNILMQYMDHSAFSETPESHFGLGFEEYTYFTSPNRRYADIVVHRMIKAKIKNQSYNLDVKSIIPYLNEKTKEVEQAVSEAERWLKCIYMNNLRNKTFEAEVTGATSTLLNVRINDNGIEGIIPINFINKDSYFDDIEFFHKMQDREIHIGDKIKITIKNINFQNKTIIFNEAR